MHTFKLLSDTTAFLYFAITQGVVIDSEPVPLYGQCGTIIGTKPCAQGVCCFLNPDNGICLLKCPETTT
ncbi:hypothetical protein C8J57DRAFT_1537572 [Mycena rebaudengoi]|nr:hypothetical protein C8J57DRAFT_1545817 [Mycena rebaudengoi]KAJ7217590.1 hypothetical protein C8J57DRAFT_1537572 [Mycena rebaudengoi]